jgi:ArsR family transcriptional regulator
MELSTATEAFGALAQPTRLAVFRLLINAGPEGIAAGVLAERLGIPHNTLSTHLGILSRARLLTSRRAGRSILYGPDIDGVRELLSFLVADCCNGRPELCAPLAQVVERASCC